MARSLIACSFGRVFPLTFLFIYNVCGLECPVSLKMIHSEVLCGNVSLDLLFRSRHAKDYGECGNCFGDGRYEDLCEEETNFSSSSFKNYIINTRRLAGTGCDTRITSKICNAFVRTKDPKLTATDNRSQIGPWECPSRHGLNTQPPCNLSSLRAANLGSCVSLACSCFLRYSAYLGLKVINLGPV